MFSIDQNCHVLWDCVPKLQALAAAGHAVTHFVEDVDVAFTALGSTVDDTVLHLTRERFHRSGGQDWGAALFYAEFLGKLPVEIRHWEPLTGMKTATVARHLGWTVDELYEEFSPGDTWQLIGSSYIGDRDHHRVIGDLSVAETLDFLFELFHKARDDMFRAFPGEAARQRLARWFCAQEGLLAELVEAHRNAGLADLYHAWLESSVPAERVRVDRGSSLCAVGADADRAALLDVFTRDYRRAAGLYNQAIEQTDADVRPLSTEDGELPFFGIQPFQGHLVRTAAYLDDGRVRFGREAVALDEAGRLPPQALREAGIQCLAAKALLLVAQARIGEAGQPLALPYRGSLYMPTAHRLVARLDEAGLLPAPLQPLVRVRFRLLDRMRELDTVVHLPEHLQAAMGRSEVPASELGESHAELAQEAARRLERLGDDAARQAWQEEQFPRLTARIDELDSTRREMAQRNCTPEEMHALWEQEKGLRRQLLERTVRQIALDWQLRELDYWDSRGALLPWSIALGGEDFYDRLIAEADIYEEQPQPQGAAAGR
ncbi:MAG: hypothetical protein ACLF0G_18385 [Candidatus Brocadiia bacterium]